MNLLLLAPEETAADGLVRLEDRRSEHLVRILGCKPGDRVRAGIINGRIGTGEIIAVEKGRGKYARVILCFTPEEMESKPPPVDLILGLVRPIMLKKILAQAASLGVGRIYLINGNRVEKSFFAAGLLQGENYRPYLLHGLEQAKNTFLPQVSIHQRFRPFVEDFVPTIAGSYDRMLIAHPEAGKDIRQALGKRCGGRKLLAIGPEGGWVDFELDKFIQQSFEPVSLGKRILRTDTAVVALLAQLMLLQGG